MSVIPTVWCPYCESANELRAKRCWRCRQPIPAQAERTGMRSAAPMLPVPVAADTVPALAAALPAAVAAAPVSATADCPLTRIAAPAMAYAAEVERKQCIYCREWIDPEASVCPYCRTDQGAIAAVQRATWAFVQLFFCFAALGTGIVVLVRLWQWGMMGGHVAGLSTLLRIG